MERAGAAGLELRCLLEASPRRTGVVEGCPAMNLAGQSGDAGSGHLLFANFNQDNT